MTDEIGVPVRSGLVRAGLILSGAFLVSRVLGYVRTVVLGTTFGAGPELDAFFAAFRLPDLIYQAVARSEERRVGKECRL